jgi:hypothetical protein
MSVLPDSAGPDSKSFCLVCLNRPFVDGRTGFKGGLIRGTVLKGVDNHWQTNWPA